MCGMLLLSSLSAGAWAEGTAIVVTRQRIVLADVVSQVPDSLRTIDLGQAPPPGRSRYISYEELTLKLQAAGVPISNLALPTGVRVQSEAREYSGADLEALVSGPLAQSLPEGVTLIAARVLAPRVLSPQIGVGAVHLPQFSLRSGKQRQTATVEILWGDQVALRLPVQIDFSLDDRLLAQVVKRGATVTLVIRKGQVQVSTQAETLSVGRVGEMIAVRVDVTKRVVNARIVSADKVELEI